MGEMIERVARAIYEKAMERASILVGFGFDSPSWEELGEPDRTSAIGEARAAIEAMRDSTFEIRTEGQSVVNLSEEEGHYSYISRDECQGIWQTMIDAALK